MKPMNSHVMHLLQLAATLLCVLGLAACTHSGLLAQTSFKSLITDNGLKLFEMTFPRPKTNIMSTPKEQQQRGWSDRKVLAYLDETLVQNQYCREGYLVLGRYAGETTHKIRGECKEAATARDRQLYPNTIARW